MGVEGEAEGRERYLCRWRAVWNSLSRWYESTRTPSKI